MTTVHFIITKSKQIDGGVSNGCILLYFFRSPCVWPHSEAISQLTTEHRWEWTTTTILFIIHRARIRIITIRIFRTIVTRSEIVFAIENTFSDHVGTGFRRLMKNAINYYYYYYAVCGHLTSTIYLFFKRGFAANRFLCGRCSGGIQCNAVRDLGRYNSDDTRNDDTQ